MPSLEARKAQAQSFQAQIKDLLQEEKEAEPQLQKLLADWHALLGQPAVEPLDDYSQYLQQNLDYLHEMMTIINQQRSTIGAELLSIQKGKKAKQSYGHNS